MGKAELTVLMEQHVGGHERKVWKVQWDERQQMADEAAEVLENLKKNALYGKEDGQFYHNGKPVEVPGRTAVFEPSKRQTVIMSIWAKNGIKKNGLMDVTKDGFFVYDNDMDRTMGFRMKARFVENPADAMNMVMATVSSAYERVTARQDYVSDYVETTLAAPGEARNRNELAAEARTTEEYKKFGTPSDMERIATMPENLDFQELAHIAYGDDDFTKAVESLSPADGLVM